VVTDGANDQTGGRYVTASGVEDQLARKNGRRRTPLRIDVVERTPEAFGFNVTKCRYAELYQRLGIPELGAILSCNRDYALIEGFNADIALTRTQTIMQGASHCDFRYRQRPQSATSEE
jgi:hypothetical protein